MSEPEEVLIEAAHWTAVRLSPRFGPKRPDGAGPGLAELQRRLGFFLAALCPGAPPIVTAEPPFIPTWMSRVMSRRPAWLVERRILPATDGTRLRLPPRLDELDDGDGTLPAYLVIALEMALRAARRSSVARARVTSPAAADLFAIAEAAAAERELVMLAPGLSARVSYLRERMLAERPDEDGMTTPERWVEALLRKVLAAPPDRPVRAVPALSDSFESRDWAESLAKTWTPTAYRGVPAVFLWGVIEPAPAAREPAVIASDSVETKARPGRTQPMPRRPRVRPELPDEDDEKVGMAMVPIEDRQESAEDPLGLKRPLDRDDHIDPAGLADSVSELPELRVVSDPEAPREVLASEHRNVARSVQDRRTLPPGASVYPEWNWRDRGYRMPGAVVHAAPAPPGPDSWWKEVRRIHAPLLRQTQRRFERLRARRVHLPRQLDGPEPDLSAWVEAWSEAGGPWIREDRLYVATPPLRRELALVLLMDVSASTDAWVHGKRRIVDVEKEALLVILEGLEALGDRFAILAFSGESAAGVQALAIRDFASRDPLAVRRAIAGLEPSGYTRLGAAVRHASALLATQAVRHRVLLVLSDGKPNDVDEYEGRYGIEDARMAVLEARQNGLVPLCLTVDREASAYLPRIFGPGGFTMLRRVGALPEALARMLQRLVAS